MSADKIEVKWTLFGTLSKGGYLRTFESVSHPGISGAVKRETRKSPEVRVFVYEGNEYSSISEVLKAYREKRP